MSKHISVWDARQKTQFIESLRQNIAKLTDDDQAIRDTLEGELESGEVNTILESLLKEYHECLAIAKAKKALAAEWTESAKTSEVHAERIKGYIDEAMRACQRRDWKGIAGSIGYTTGRLNAHIVDEKKVPLELFKWTIDKESINKIALQRHAEREAILHDPSIPGAEREKRLAAIPQIAGVEVRRSPDSLTVRKPSGSKKKGRADVDEAE